MSAKSNKPRSTPNQTRNGRARIKPLSLTQLTELLDKTQSNRAKGKIRNRILVLEKRIRNYTKLLAPLVSVLEKHGHTVTIES